MTLQPVVRAFVFVVAEQFEQRSDFFEVRASRDFVRLLIPVDKAVLDQFREMNVPHLGELLVQVELTGEYEKRRS